MIQLAIDAWEEHQKGELMDESKQCIDADTGEEVLETLVQPVEVDRHDLNRVQSFHLEIRDLVVSLGGRSGGTNLVPFELNSVVVPSNSSLSEKTEL
ncbi:hypothetical protein FCV25MIE_25779 [Fagus crenata]